MESLTQGSGTATPSRLSWSAAVSFENWAEVLAAKTWRNDIKIQVRRDVSVFLRFCQVRHTPASLALAKIYIDDCERRTGREDRKLRGALRWFFQADESHKQVAGEHGPGGQARTPRSTRSR